MKWFLSFNFHRILFVLFLFILISVPFGTKKFIYSFGDLIDEFRAIFLYGSDILLILFLGLAIAYYKKQATFDVKKILSLLKEKIYFQILIIFLIFCGFSIFFADYKILAFYQFIRLTFLILSVLVIVDLFKKGLIKFQFFVAVFAISSFFQALVAILQFKFFRSLGLWFLGEPVVDVFTPNVAWFRIGDLIFLRSFGTLPHANILAAFLILGLISFYYLWIKSFSKNGSKFIFRVFLTIGLFFVFLALLFTFSRSGWLVAAIVSSLFLILVFLNKDYRKASFSLLIVIFVCCWLIISNFDWLFLPRAQFSATEPSVNYRWLYNKIGLEVIRENILGVGIGNQLFYAVNNNLYQKFGIFHQKDWQPIHNIYLLIASEIGVFGLLFFGLFVVFLIFENLKRWQKKEIKIEVLTAVMMLISLLLFSLVDHFSWTLQSGRLMFWLASSLVLGTSLVNNSLKSS